MSVDGTKVVSSVTLPATAEVLKDGVTCEVSNEHGAESKVVPVAVKKGQLLLLPFMFSCHTLKQQLPNEPLRNRIKGVLERRQTCV